MDHDTYTIVFRKLAEAGAEQGNGGVVLNSPTFREELDEIDELRRIVLEITEPEAPSYTTA
jgi:hypothetical protein